MAPPVVHDVQIPQSTIGVSPKVLAFITAVGGPGILLLILGLLLGDAELRAAGLALLAGSALGGAAGYKAPPGAFPAGEVGPASDELLPEHPE